MWIMPAGVVQGTVDELALPLAAGDTVIDGGNSYYRDDIHRAEALSERGIHYVDCGTSGGVWGRERGYALMIGGDDEAVERLAPIWETIAPARWSTPSNPRRAGPTAGTAQDGWLHWAQRRGHFVKMVHNGIEYG